VIRFLKAGVWVFWFTVYLMASVAHYFTGWVAEWAGEKEQRWDSLVNIPSRKEE